VVLIVLLVIFFGDNSSIYNIETASSIDTSTYEAIDKTSKFGTTTPEIFVAFGTQDLEIGTMIVGIWKYDGGEIASSSLITSLEEHQAYFSLTSPTSGWPLGDYELIFQINDEEVASTEFSVIE